MFISFVYKIVTFLKIQPKIKIDKNIWALFVASYHLIVTVHCPELHNNFRYLYFVLWKFRCWLCIFCTCKLIYGVKIFFSLCSSILNSFLYRAYIKITTVRNLNQFEKNYTDFFFLILKISEYEKFYIWLVWSG